VVKWYPGIKTIEIPGWSLRSSGKNFFIYMNASSVGAAGALKGPWTLGWSNKIGGRCSLWPFLSFSVEWTKVAFLNPNGRNLETDMVLFFYMFFRGYFSSLRFDVPAPWLYIYMVIIFLWSSYLFSWNDTWFQYFPHINAEPASGTTHRSTASP